MDIKCISEPVMLPIYMIVIIITKATMIEIIVNIDQ